jgi:hypothetical protein
MGIQDRYLYPIFDAGSSRVFNICAQTTRLTQQLRESGSAEPPAYLFNTRELNRSILVKEARTERNAANRAFRKPVGTKIYLPYNPERIYDGGKSAFFDDPRIEQILLDHTGIDINSANDKIKADLGLIRLLDEIPSLDPFLVKDKLRIEGIKANEAYFDISETEWLAIQTFVSDKLKPIVDFAFKDSDDVQRGRTLTFVNKLWDTKDIQALMPIVKAFNLPADEASGIFAAWKGIMYYDYEYARYQSQWHAYNEWLENGTVPLDFVDPERKELLLDLQSHVIENFESSWNELKTVFAAYEEAYKDLFVDRKDPGPFIAFMRDAVRSYWILGTRMSAINHCISVWDTLTAHSFKRRLKFDQLFSLLDLQREISQQA